MASLLERMAQTALGTAPAVLPVERPLFAAARRIAPDRESDATEAFTPGHATMSPAEGDRISMPPGFNSDTSRFAEELPTLRPARRHSATAADMPALNREPGPPLPTLPARPTLRQVMDRLFPEPGETGKPSPLSVQPPAQHENTHPEPKQPMAARDSQSTAAVEPRSRMTAITKVEERATAPRPYEVSRLRKDPEVPRPDVQVTIGRIDLKAAPQPAPVAAVRASRPPHMTLTEYLERRKRGRE